MKRSQKVGVGCLIAFVVLPAILVTYGYEYLGENDAWGHTASDLRILDLAVKTASDERGQVTLEQLRQLQTIDEFADIVTPYLEEPTKARLDARNRPLLFERSEEADRVVLTIRSDIKHSKRWSWQKERPLVLEITVFNDREKAIHTRQLWRDD